MYEKNEYDAKIQVSGKRASAVNRVHMSGLYVVKAAV